LVLREWFNMRIDEDIRVDQNHLKASASAMARLSLMLSMLANRNLPSATFFVLNGSRCLGRVVKSLSPLRGPH
jgi:hypothetical protein